MILRTHLHRVEKAFENLGDKFDFKSHRFIVYYTMHLLTLILGWILFIARYLPEVFELGVGLKTDSAIGLRAGVYSIILGVVFFWGLYAFWLKQQYASSSILNAYKEHNDPSADADDEEGMLGPAKPPKCSLTTTRLALAIISVIAAALYPMMNGYEI